MLTKCEPLGLWQAQGVNRMLDLPKVLTGCLDRLFKRELTGCWILPGVLTGCWIHPE